MVFVNVVAVSVLGVVRMYVCDRQLHDVLRMLVDPIIPHAICAPCMCVCLWHVCLSVACWTVVGRVHGVSVPAALPCLTTKCQCGFEQSLLLRIE